MLWQLPRLLLASEPPVGDLAPFAAWMADPAAVRLDPPPRPRSLVDSPAAAAALYAALTGIIADNSAFPSADAAVFRAWFEASHLPPPSF